MVPGKRLIKLVFEKRGFLITFDIPCQPAKRFKNSSKHYTGRMRGRVVTATVTRRGGRRELKLVTDRFDPPARIVMELYRFRWSVEALFRLLKRGGFDLEKPSARPPQGVVAHVPLVIPAFLLAVLASTACGTGFNTRHPSVLRFKSWLRVHGGGLLSRVFKPAT